MAKDIDNLIRKKMKRRDELMREVRQIDVELEALQTASVQIGGLKAFNSGADALLRARSQEG